MRALRDLAARRPFAVALVAALAVLLVPYRTLLGPGVPSGRDLVPYFYPLKTQLAAAIRSGEIPWIDPFRWGGLPLLSWPGTAAFDPGNVLFLFLPTAVAAKAWMLLRVVSGAAGFAVFLRLSGLPPLSSALGGLVWGAGGITASAASFLSTSSALAALPWLAAALLRARRDRSARSVALLALATALLVVASVPEPLVAAALLAVVLLAGRGERPARRERLGAALLWGAAALLGALLAAPTISTWVVAGLESVRSVPGALLPGFAAQGALPVSRLPDLLVDGVVADWTRVLRVDGIPGYPYFPSLTPGRLAFTLALLGLVVGRIAVARPLAVALVGVLLALGPATPLFGLFVHVVPFASSVRYPEKYAVLFAFGVAWLAAVGAAALERATGARRAVPVFVVAGLLLVLDRAAITPRLLPLSPPSILAERPAVLSALPAPREGEAPPRYFPSVAYRPPSSGATDDPRETGTESARWAFPWAAGRFGAATVFEPDYDASLPRPQLEWVLLLESTRAGGPAPAALARAAGALGSVEVAAGPRGAPVPALRLFADPVPPYRFVEKVVRSRDPREAAAGFLGGGAPTSSAFVAGAGEGFAPAPGQVFRVSDRPSALELEVEGRGPGPSYLLVCRPLAATRETLLDGRRIPVENANVGFTGIAIPPGRHVVRLRPPRTWLIIPAVLSALGLTALILLLRRDLPEDPEAR